MQEHPSAAPHTEADPAEGLLEGKLAKARLVGRAHGAVERARPVRVLELKESQEIRDGRAQRAGASERRQVPMRHWLPAPVVAIGESWKVWRRHLDPGVDEAERAADPLANEVLVPIPARRASTWPSMPAPKFE